MLDKELLPWERDEQLLSIRRRCGFMHSILMRMVSRRPENRPALREVDAAWRAKLMEGTTAYAASDRSSISAERSTR